ncbi:hypothetical protein Fmac_024360 [Flemingia macrophylla]|uniref:Uncharacterized protein n=1 Tax=Flemingia macrophylla TaxID=520843 RepID=A0ABD1LP52_9FABA
MVEVNGAKEGAWGGKALVPGKYNMYQRNVPLNSEENDKNGIIVDVATYDDKELASNVETFGVASTNNPWKSLELTKRLMEKGNKAIKESDFGEEIDHFIRALEIKVVHYGELAFKGIHPYYKYGCPLLYKAWEEVDHLANVPKKGDGFQHGSNKDRFITAFFPSIVELDVSSNGQGTIVEDRVYKE